MSIRIITAIMFVLAGLQTATAQFAGDVYFDQPSISVPAGGKGQFEVVVFSGDRPLGAAHVQIAYDPGQIEIVAVEPGDAEELDRTFVSEVEPGRLSFVALNDSSLTEPFGTVSLARIEVRAVGPAGTRSGLDITVENLLDERSDPFPAFAGLSGEAVITASDTSSQLSIASERSPTAGAVDRVKARERAGRMGRPGQRITVQQRPAGGGTPVPTTVMVNPLPSEESENAR